MTMAITALYVALLGMFVVALGLHVSGQRLKQGVSLGHGEQQPLLLAIAAHRNAVENVPLALLLLLALENTVGQAWLVHTVGVTVVVGRLLHAYGVTRSPLPNAMRLLGSLLTWLAMMGAGLMVLIAVTYPQQPLPGGF